MTSTASVPAQKPAHVLAVTDFSDASDEALRQASGYARMTGAKLSVLHAVPDILPVSPLLPAGSVQRIHSELDLETRALDAMAERVKSITGRLEDGVSLAIRTGRADVAVVRFAEENDVDVIVAGATGRSGVARFLLGSTAERLVRHAHCSVLIARDSPPSEHVLCATDLSDVSLPAIERAKLEVEWRRARLELVHVIDFANLAWSAAAAPFGPVALRVPPEQMAEMRKLAWETLRGLGGPRATVNVEDGSPKQKIVSLAESLPAALVVLGTHGRTGLPRMALGSVAEAVVRAAPCSVLVVRAGATKPAS